MRRKYTKVWWLLSSLFLCISTQSSATDYGIKKLTFVFMPVFITSAAPLDEAQLLKLACVVSTSNTEQYDRFHNAITVSEQEGFPAPLRNFRQMIIFENGNNKEKYYFRMQQDHEETYSVRKVRDNDVSGIKVTSVLWNHAISGADSGKFIVINSPSGAKCTDFSIFFNQNK